jgi:hypothetical protein
MAFTLLASASASILHHRSADNPAVFFAVEIQSGWSHFPRGKTEQTDPSDDVLEQNLWALYATRSLVSSMNTMAIMLPASVSILDPQED